MQIELTHREIQSAANWIDANIDYPNVPEHLDLMAQERENTGIGYDNNALYAIHEEVKKLYDIRLRRYNEYLNKEPITSYPKTKKENLQNGDVLNIRNGKVIVYKERSVGVTTMHRDLLRKYIAYGGVDISSAVKDKTLYTYTDKEIAVGEFELDSYSLVENPVNYSANWVSTEDAKAVPTQMSQYVI